MTQFSNDIEWKAGEGLYARISAFQVDKAAVMVLRQFTKEQSHRIWLVYFNLHADCTWTPDTNTDGQVQVFDVTDAGAALELDVVPGEVSSALPEAANQLLENTRNLVELGAKRNVESIQASITAAKDSVRKAMATLNEARDGVAAYAAKFVPGFDVANCRPSKSPFVFDTIVGDFAYGPLIFSVKGPQVFTLETPGSVELYNADGAPVRVRLTWVSGRVNGLPADKEVAAALQDLCTKLSVDHTDAFRRAAVGQVEEFLHGFHLQMEALVRYSDVINDREKAELRLAATEDAGNTASLPSI